MLALKTVSSCGIRLHDPHREQHAYTSTAESRRVAHPAERKMAECRPVWHASRSLTFTALPLQSRHAHSTSVATCDRDASHLFMRHRLIAYPTSDVASLCCRVVSSASRRAVRAFSSRPWRSCKLQRALPKLGGIPPEPSGRTGSALHQSGALSSGCTDETWWVTWP